MTNSPFSKIDRELSLSEKTEQQILDAIRQKIFLPGDKLLGEMELAANFGVSRTVVRESLHRLAGRGVVEIRKNFGVYVSPNQYSSLTDSFYHLLELKCGESSLVNIANVRLIIEPEIARLAATNRSSGDIQELKVTYSKMEIQINDPQKMISYDIDFHRIIAMTTKNPILPVIMEPLFQMMTKFISATYEFPHSPLLALKSHFDILSCIKDQDAGGAYKAMYTHMAEAKDHALSISKIIQQV